MIHGLAGLLCGLLFLEGPGMPASDNPASLEAACDAGTPLACYQVALRYRDGVGVEKDRGRFETLVREACTMDTTIGRRGGAPPGQGAACFTGCMEGIEGLCRLLMGSPQMWQAMREFINAPDTAARLQIVATTRDLLFLRKVQGCHDRYDECKAVPDLETLLEATRARVREIALTDPDPGRRSFAVRDGQLQGVGVDDVQQIAKNDPDPMVRKSAEKTLFSRLMPWTEEGAAKLLQMSRSRDVEDRRRAVAKLMDPARLAEMAEKDEDRKVRDRAVWRLGDYADDWQPVLIRIAEKDEDERVRSAAAARVSDRSALERLLRGSRVASVRRHALENLEGRPVDMSLLLWVAEHDKDNEIRREAASRIADQGILARLAQSSRSYEVRATATARLEDQKLLAEIAVHDPVDWVYKAAIDKLEDEAILADVARRRPEEYVQELIIQKTSDQELLAQLARTEGSLVVPYVAIRKLTDQEALEEIASSHSARGVREAAKRRLAELRAP